MDEKRNVQQPSWLPELMELVRRELSRLTENQHDQRPALEQEVKVLDGKIKGWSESLAKPDLTTALRTAIESDWSVALERRQEIENILTEREAQSEQADRIVDESEVLRRLEQLADVLADNNPTMGNLHLSLHIDRIVCAPDGKVVMRSCKLGTLTEAVEIFANIDDNGDASGNIPKKTRGTPRRRGRLRVESFEEDGRNMRSLAEFAADTDRFAGLSDDWFWTDEFQIPDKPLSWVAENAEGIFLRRQDAQLSHGKLAAEFGVSKPTIGAAIKHYLATHPDAKDEVNLASGGARPIKFNIEKFADEARQLWENDWSKLKLAKKYGCSTPIIDKALVFAYEQARLPMPTRKDRQNSKSAEARQMLDAGNSLDEIAEALDVSDVTVRQYLKASFSAEGKSMPDLRSRRGKQ
ncbi:MAG: hypothetical protein IID42_03505 [Planctomycetes bacterium]|nr:hypothetical protein [Planctomycetota bacterium]